MSIDTRAGTSACVQERYAPANMCFGCGPANARGLRLRSFEEGDTLVCDFAPEPHYIAFPGMLNGGICGTLLDCHSNWTAAIHLMKRAGRETPPCTVTAEYAIKLRRPTPLAPLRLVARVVESTDDRVTVEAELIAAGKITATCRGLFVAVKEGHPAFQRW
jgi:acyl-coenzyme A thioesterase PaaI-like protein